PEHPACMLCATKLATTVFGSSYDLARAMPVSLALAAAISAVGSWWFNHSMLWITGAALIFAVVPFTLIVIFPTDKRLLKAGIDRSSPETHMLLVRWARLHAVRTVASLSATVFFWWPY